LRANEPTMKEKNPLIEQCNIFGGVDLVDPEQDKINSKRNVELNKSGGHKTNPLLKLYGTKEGEKCKGCKFLYKRQFSNTYYKCEKRGEAKASVKNDHRVNWPACGLFQKSLIKNKEL